MEDSDHNARNALAGVAVTQRLQIDGTREQILALLRRHDRMGVEDLAQELGLAGATVRRHLDVLLRDNLVTMARERGGTGRPRHLFALTETGADIFRQHYVRMTRRLMGEIVALSATETAGRSGAELADLVFRRMAERLSGDLRAQVGTGSLLARARSLAALLSDEGLEFEAMEDPQAGGVRLAGRGCPCARLLGHHDGSCSHDQLIFEQVLDAAVEPLSGEDVGAEYECGYLLRERALSPAVEAARLASLGGVGNRTPPSDH